MEKQTIPTEIICKMQKDMLVQSKWCDQVQYDELCKGCLYNKKRLQSKYQKSRKQ